MSELEQNVSLLIQASLNCEFVRVERVNLTIVLCEQENTSLEEKVCVMQQKDEEMKTLQDQIVYLEEIR